MTDGVSRRSGRTLGWLMFAVLAMMATAIVAQSAPILGDDRATMVAARTALDAARRASREADDRAERFEAAAATAESEAAQVQARAAALAARIQRAEAAIAATRAELDLIEQLRTAQRARLAAQQGPTVQLVAALQVMGLRPPVAALAAPGSTDDLVHLRAVLGTIGPAIEARTGTLRADVARGDALKAQAEAAVARLRTSQSELLAERGALERLAMARRQSADRLTGSALTEQDRALALGEEARDLDALIARIDDVAAVRARLESLPGPLLRPARPGDPRPAPTENTTTAGQARYRLPAIGAIVTGLGEVSDAGVRARGLTIATLESAQVVAPTGGRIVYAAPYRGYGQIVIIDHGRGWTTLLTGLARIDARVGDTVSQGSPIGIAGNRRPTITVELRRQGQPVDITRLIG